MDVALVWQLWDRRCSQLEPLQHKSDGKLADIMSLMQQVPSPGRASASGLDYSLLLDDGELSECGCNVLCPQ